MFVHMFLIYINKIVIYIYNVYIYDFYTLYSELF